MAGASGPPDGGAHTNPRDLRAGFVARHAPGIQALSVMELTLQPSDTSTSNVELEQDTLGRV